MKTRTFEFFGQMITLQRYPTSRRVVPSQNQRELKEGQVLSDLAVAILIEHAKLDEDPPWDYTLAPAYVTAQVCEHTPAEIREMAHNLHVAEQSELIKNAVQDDPAFFGAEGVDDLVPAPRDKGAARSHGLHACTTECRL